MSASNISVIPVLNPKNMMGVLSYLLEAHNKAQILAHQKRYNLFQNDFN
jgi:hypothetical protein